ncbi:unnamed protein product [Peronospora effusa]|nr:unnamed protein product [Peronospora effusa]
MKHLFLRRHGISSLMQRRHIVTSSLPIVPRSDRDRQLLSALQVYYRLEGHFTVPFEFVVPSNEDDTTTSSLWPKETWGMDLGKRLRIFTRGRNIPYTSALLQSIGFLFPDWRTYVWEMQLIPGLKVFQQEEGHLFVRQHFQIPFGDTKWPRSTWGVKLGSQCQIFRRNADHGLSEQRKQQLDAMGFIWSDAQWKWEMQFLTALKKYRNIYGHCNVHHTFKVPMNDTFWPQVSWGYRLGVAVAKIKNNFDEHMLSPHQVADLKNLGFFQTELASDMWRNALMPALELYPTLYGDTFIAQDFVVPSNTPWPERAWGINLGYIVKTINSTVIFRAEMENDKQKLKKLGYAWDSLFGKWVKELLPALRLYKAKFGNCDIPSWWVVPTNDASWPKALRGYHLGKQVVQIRRTGRRNAAVADVLTELGALGFKFNAFESTFVDRVLPALEVYVKIYGDTHVPQGFIVPSESTWPQPSWGTKLGHIVHKIRIHHPHAQHVELYRERLKKIGFVWSIYKSSAATKRDIVDPSLEVYKEINGEGAEISRNFVVPADDSRYPDIAKRFELGAWLTQYNKRTIGLLPFQTHDDTKKTVLMDNKVRRPRTERNLSPHVEQYWKDVLLCSFQVYAKLHGSCKDMVGSFVVPHEKPYPQSAWGLNLGLRLRHIRHGIRYANESAKYKDELENLGVLLDGDAVMLESNIGKHASKEGGFDEDKSLNNEDYSDDEDFGEDISDAGINEGNTAHIN